MQRTYFIDWNSVETDQRRRERTDTDTTQIRRKETEGYFGDAIYGIVDMIVDAQSNE